MRIFITGGTGFIGSWLVPRLASAGHTVRILSRTTAETGTADEAQPVTFVRGDLGQVDLVREQMAAFRAEALVHLAWEGLPDYSRAFCLKNLHNSIDLFAAALDAGCRTILSTGSCWEYESRETILPENAALNTTDLFPSVKNALRFTGSALARGNGARFYWLPLFFVYGPGQREGALIPSIVSTIRAGQVPQIKTPLNRNDFIFVEDVATAIAAIIEKQPAGTIYNVGTGISTSVREIVACAYRLLGIEFDGQAFDSQDAPLQDFYADISRINQDLDWHPDWPIERGIARYIEWAAGRG